MVKNILSLALVLLLCLGLAACGGTAPEPVGTSPAAPAPESTAAPTGTETTAAEAQTTTAAETAPAAAEETADYEPPRTDTDTLTWDFDAATGTLALHGTGPMRDYTEEAPEWQPHAQEILTVTLDEGITSVGAYAFADYRSLTAVTLPDSVEVIDISAFDYDWMLEAVNLPASLKYVGSRAFYNTLLHTPEDLVFPEGCVYIGDAAFHSALKTDGTVSLPATLRYLGKKAFTNAFISDFTVAEGNPCYCAEDHAVYTKDKKDLLMVAPSAAGLTEFAIPEGVERLAPECFNLIHGIQRITVPASVSDIPEGAFFSTFDLTEIAVDEANPRYMARDGLLLTRDGSLLLAWPDGKPGSELAIPEGVTRLGAYLFYGRYDGGYTVLLPEGVRELGTMCLPGQMASLSLPASLEKIDGYVFYDGIAVDAITYNGTAEGWAKVAVGEGNTGLDSAAIRMK